MPVIAQSPEGRVISVWGTALIRGADGKLRLLKVGDLVHKGDQILTTQDGIVQIAEGEGAAQTAQARKPATPAGDDVERAIGELNRGEGDAAPAAGLTGGGDGSLQEGLRVERIGEALGAAEVPRSSGDAERRTEINDTGVSDGSQASGPTPLNTPSSAISAVEEGAPANLGLRAPTGPAASGTIRVDQVPAVGEIHKADGTLVTAGTVLTPADLPGLIYVPPAEYDGAVPAGNFSYTLTTADGRSNTGGTSIALSPLNDAPVATPGSASGNEDGSLPISLSGTDVDGRIVGVTVTALPAGGTLWLADGVTPVAVGQTLTPAQAGSLLYRPGADFHGDQTILFTVTDNGGATSAPAAISLTVVSVNDLPQASGSGGSGNEDTPIAVHLGGSDVDGSVVAVTVTTLPANGTLFLADGITPVAAGSTLTPAQAANLVFVPNPNFSGNVTIGFTLTDDQGGTSAPGSAVVTVQPVNDAPVAQPDAATLAEDSFAAGNVLGNDSDIDGPALAVASFTFGGNTFAAGSTAIVGGVGTLSVAANGDWTFTPAPNFNGAVPPIVITISDGSLSSTSALTLTVTAVNDAPLAQADLASTPINTPATIAVLANDSDVEGQALTVTAATLANPAQGTVVINPDGTLGFVPAANFTGTVTINYTVSDASGASSVSTVTVNVGNNTAPSGADVARSLPEDGSYTLQPADLGFSDADAGQALAGVRIDTLPAAGTLLLNGAPVAAGTVVSAAQLAAGALQFLPAADGNGSNYAHFTFSVQDSAGAFDATPNTFRFDVTPVNDAPVASGSTITVAEESVNTPLGLVAPTDIDGDALIITVTGLPTVGTITLADGTPVTNGQVLTAAQLAGLQFDAPADLAAATTTTFTYSVNDGTSTVNAGTTINVTPVNDAPVASSSAITVAEESVDTPLGLVAPTDADGNALTITVTGLPTVGTVTLADGTPVINGQVLTATQLAGLQFDAPADLAAATTTTFTYSVSDGTATVNAGTTINVTPINDAPVAQAAAFTVAEDAAVVNGAVTATDADAGATFTFALNGAAPAGLTFNSNGTYAFDPANAAYQSLGVGQQTIITVPYTVTDNAGATSTANLVITVTGTNDAPAATADTVAATEDNALTITPATLLGNDTDIDSGTALTITSVQGAVNGTVALVGGNVVFTPAANYNGPASFTYTVSDGNGGTSTATVTVNVAAVNDAPVAQAASFAVVEDAAVVSGAVTATDVDAGATLTFALNGAAPAGLTFNSDGSYSFDPANAAYQSLGVGQQTIITVPYTVTDNAGATSTANLVITVTGTNDAPVAVANTVAATEDNALTIAPATLLGNDTDIDSGTTLTITSVQAAVNGTVALVGGNVVFTPAANYNGPASFTYTVSDGNGGSSTATVTVNVAAVNDAPVASSSTITVAEESTNTPLGLSAPTDVDGDALTITVTGLPAVGTITLADGTPVTNGQVLTAAQLTGLQFDAPADQLAATTTTFTYSVNDGSTTVNAGTTINVTPVNDAPVATNDLASTAINVALPVINVLANDSDVDGDALTVTSATLAVPAQGSVTINADGSLNFVPANNVSGPVLINYTIADGHGGTATASVTVNVGTNTPPQGADATVSVVEDGSRVFAPSDFGFTDADAGQSLAAVRIDALPGAGTLLLNGSPLAAGAVVTLAQLNAGALSYAPAPNANGAAYASFGFSVQDNAGSFDTSPNTITINVTPVNDAPVASSSTITVAEESVNTSLGLAAPSDVDGDALTITVTGLPAVGTITLADGTPVTNGQVLTAAQLAGLQFDAPADLAASTTTTFTYSVNDGTTTVNAGTTINVTPINDAPVAQASAFTVAEDAAIVNGAVTATDADAGATFAFALNGAAPAGLTFNADGTYAFDPANAAYQSLAVGQQTIITVPYTVTDNAGATSTANLVITVTGTNDAPVATADTVAATEDNALTIAPATLLGNDTDIDSGTTLTISSVQGAVNGTVALVGGNVVFTPAANYNGPASFTYTVSDGNGGTSTATVTVNVAAVNDAPVAQAASFTVAEDAAVVSGAVTATDVDAGATLTFALNGAAPAGLTFNSDGSYSFDPANAAYQSLGVGQQSVITVPYTVTDNAGATSTANLVITVTGTNDAPVAQAAAFTVAEDAALVNGVVTASDADAGATFTFALNGAAPAGLIFNSNGTYSFDPANAAYQSLGVGQQTIITVPYTVTDNAGATSTANLVITVTGTNDAPVATADTVAATEDNTLTIAPATLLGNDTDIDSGTTLTITSVQGAVNGSVALVGGNVVFTPAANYNGPASFTYTVSDGNGGSSTATVTVNVAAVNDAPVASSSTITVAEESVDTPLGLAAPTDVDGNALTITVTGLPAVGTVTLADGTPVTNGQVLTAAQLAGLQFDAPADLAAATTTTFTYSVSDGTATVAAGTTINVTPVNDAPVAQAASFTVAEDAAVVNGAVTATDADAGATFTFALNGAAPAGLTFNTNGSYSFDPANAAYQSLGVGQQTIITVPYTVTDNAGATSTANLVITVTGTNDAPVATADTVAATEDNALTITPATLLGNDTDIDSGTTLTITSVQGAVNGTVALVGGNVVFTPAANYNGPASFTYTVSDGNGGTSTATVTVNVAAVNDAPVASSSTITVAEESTNTPLGLSAPTDVDGDALTITVTGLPAVGTVTLADGTPVTNGQVLTAAQLAGLQFDAPADLAASTTTTFTYSVNDGTTTVNAGTTINVTPINDAPVAQASAFTVAEDAAIVNGAVTATDADAGATFTFALNGAAPAGLSFNADGTYAFDPANAAYQSLAVGQQTIITVPYTVTDNAGATSTANLVITVTGTNDAPVAVANTVAATEDNALTIAPATLLGNDTDIDSGTTLTISSVQGAVNGTVALVGGNVVFTPAANYNGPASFTYTVSDGNGGSSTATVTVNVAAVNDAPVAQAASFTVAEDAALVNGAVTATDVDAGATLTFALNGAAPAGLTFNSDGSYSFDPANAAYQSLGVGQQTIITVPYTVTDNAGATSTANLVITVTGTNDAPVATADTVAATEDNALTIAPATLLGNDADIDSGTTLTISSVQGAVNGTVALVGGNVVFTPAANYNGPASFTYTVSDGNGGTSTATVTVNVAAVNDAPVAQAASFTVAEDAAVVSGAVTATDVDAGATLTFALNGAAPAGLTFNSDGSYSFDPANAAYQSLGVGQQTVITVPYTVTDNAGATSTANLVITVTGTNDAPVAVANTGTLAEGATLSAAAGTGVLANDTDIDSGDTRTVSAVSFGATPGTVGSALVGTYGTLTLNADGSYTYVADHPAAKALIAGQSAVETFSYTVRDAAGATASTTLSFTVTGADDAPVITGPLSGAVTEDVAPGTTGGTLIITDADAGQSSFVAQSGTAGTYGTFAITTAGVWTYTLNNAAANVQALPGGATPTETFTITTADGTTRTITVTVNGANDAPVANGNTVAATEDTALTIAPATLLGNDTDVDSGTTLTIASVQGAVNGTVALVGGNVVFTPAANYNGPASFTYTVSDGNGGTSTATVTVNVAAVNDAPVAQAASFTVAEDAAVVNGAVTATDVDAGATLSFALNGAAPAGLTFNTNGSYSFNPANAAYQSLGVGQQTIITVPYTVTDNAGATSTANLVITVTGTNDAPVAVANTVAATEDNALTIAPATLLGNDTDVDSGTTLTITSVQAAVNGTVALVGGNVVFTPATNYNGPASFTYTISDGNGGTSTATVTVNVAAVNDAPINSVPGAQAINEDTTRVFSSANGNAITVADIDSGSLTTTLSAANGTLTLGSTAGVTVTGNGSGTVTITGSAAAINAALNGTTFTPTANYSGATSVTVTTSDGSASDTDSIAINITPVADAPSLTIDVRGSTVSFTSSGETAANSNNTSESVSTNPFEGWTRVNTPDNNPGGTNAVEVWTTGDTQQRQNGGNNIVVASIGNGDNFIELNDASSNLQTIGLTRTVSTQAGMVYELSLDYAGRPGFTADYTRIGVYVDGVLVQQYASTSPQTYLDWQNLKFAFVGDGANHVITIQTDATQFDPNGRGAMIDDITLTGTPGVVAGNAASGTLTSVALDTFVSAPLVDGDGSETLTLTFSGLPSGAVIVTAANPGGYTASGGSITISGAELASAQLQFSSSVTGHLSVGVTATATESANGATATATSTLDLDVLPKFSSSDLGGDGLNNIIGTTGDNSLNGTNNADYLIGRAGTDTLTANGGNDYLDGGSGNDSLNGGSGADVLYGGAGSDSLTGGTGSDVFAWTLSDRGTAGAGPVDTIADFNTASQSAGGDVLDLRDLLVGENSGNLANFIHFSTDGTSTTIQISSTGAFSGGNYAGATDQTIVLTGVNLLTGGLTTDQQVIQDLLNKAKLVVDG